jgi:enoyl-CoA hydratase/carnithine racemase
MATRRSGGAGGEEVLVRREGSVATITIDRPADQNRLTPDVLHTLARHVDDLGADERTQAVVVTGGGAEFFSMGILNPAVRATYTKDQIIDLVRLANRLYDAIEALPQVTIAALNGIARAGAAELALACDIRLAAAHATFALPEARWGGFPGAGGPVRLPAIVGRARALEIICTGRELDAAEMERVGLVLAVHPADRLLPEALALAGRIAAAGPLATRGAKRIVNLRATSGFAARARVEPRRGRGDGGPPRGAGAALHGALRCAPLTSSRAGAFPGTRARPRGSARSPAATPAGSSRAAPRSRSTTAG